jgi:hypothetical protein
MQKLFLLKKRKKLNKTKLNEVEQHAVRKRSNRRAKKPSKVCQAHNSQVLGSN